jgi:hypothetical protein
MEGEVGLSPDSGRGAEAGRKGIKELRGVKIAYANDAKSYFFSKEYRSGDA